MNVLSKLKRFYFDYNGDKFVAGRSELGRDVYCFKVCKTERPIVVAQYAIHAREYITTHLAIEQIKAFNATGARGTVYFIPMVNPDGVHIALTKDELYKANANGVDLNVNFPARWGSGKMNVSFSGRENFIGRYPLCEKESKLLADLTIKVNADVTVSYHAKGEEIYWQFFQNEKEMARDFKLALELSRVTGYKIKQTPDSAGGYKDWCIQNLKIPAYTIEVGDDKLSHPIKALHLKSIFQKNKNVINVITESDIWN